MQCETLHKIHTKPFAKMSGHRNFERNKRIDWRRLALTNPAKQKPFPTHHSSNYKYDRLSQWSIIRTLHVFPFWGGASKFYPRCDQHYWHHYLISTMNYHLRSHTLQRNIAMSKCNESTQRNDKWHRTKQIFIIELYAVQSQLIKVPFCCNKNQRQIETNYHLLFFLFGVCVCCSPKMEKL